MSTPQFIVDKIRFAHPLAQPSASLQEQWHALAKRALAFELPRVWELERETWCFCDAGRSGHEQGTVGCLFDDGEKRAWMCPHCRKPAHVIVRRWSESRGYYGSAPAYENMCEVWCECCESEPHLPDGTPWNQVNVEDLKE